jgi:C4-dicarboxylate transporter DctM subunit
MRRLGYDSRFAAACMAAGGALGILIPPSTLFIIYGWLTNVSTGKLFIAGILPGLLSAFPLWYILT